MSGANYAHCKASKCLQQSTKVFYIGEDSIPDDARLYHEQCLRALFLELVNEYTVGEEVAVNGRLLKQAINEL